MKQVLSGCSRAIAVILAILFVITALIVLLIFNFEHELFNPELYKEALLEQDLYEVLPGLMAKQMQYGMTYNPCQEDPSRCEGEGPPAEGEEPGDGEGGPPEFFRNLTDEDWELLLSGLIPRDWLQTQTESIIDQLFDMLDSGAADSQVLVSMAGLKAHMLGPDGMDAILGLIRAQPDCTTEQLVEMEQLSISMSTVSTLLTCNPPRDFLNAKIPEIRPILQEIVSGIKDEVNLLESLAGAGDDEPQQPGSQPEGNGGLNLGTLGLIRLAIRLSPLLPLALLFGITLFGVRSLKGFFRWWGIPLMIVGVIALAGSSLVPLLVQWAIGTYGPSLAPGGITPELLDLVFDLVQFVLRSMAVIIALQAGIMAVAGLAFIVGSFFVRQRRPAAAAPPA